MRILNLCDDRVTVCEPHGWNTHCEDEALSKFIPLKGLFLSKKSVVLIIFSYLSPKACKNTLKTPKVYIDSLSRNKRINIAKNIIKMRNNTMVSMHLPSSPFNLSNRRTHSKNEQALPSCIKSTAGAFGSCCQKRQVSKNV